MRKISLFIFLLCSVKLFALNDAELINSESAYTQGITGKGVVVGVIDSAFNDQHPSLQGQVLGQIYSTLASGQNYTPDFSVDTHGSHVAGIILAKRTGASDPHGVAYEAQMYGVQSFGSSTGSSTMTAPDVYNYFKDKNIKIINNSWNSSYYPVAGVNVDKYDASIITQNPQFFLNTAYGNSPNTKQLADLAKDQKVLSVFAAGNEGIISAGLNGMIPRYDEEIRSYLVVGALDSPFVSKNATSGKLEVSAKGLASYSNALLGAENFSLVAPGTGVSNVNSNFASSGQSLYAVKSGTSMAAPMVSGAAALVAQKFSFLNGKQIADVLLSTANKDYEAPKLTVKETTISQKVYYTIIYIDTANAPNATDIARIKADLQSAGYSSTEADNITNNLITNHTPMQGYEAVRSVSKEALFGQGILDIEKALKGLAVLDANRLNTSDILSTYGQQEAYYTLDTAGIDAEFSNDITQKKWEASLHQQNALNLPAMQNLNVGLIKEGNGKLSLSGNNTYEGMSVVKQGELSLIQRNANGGRLKGSVQVLNGGIFSGNGIVEQNVNNEGIVRAGNEDLKDLTIQGAYTQGANAKLQLEFGNTGNSKLIATSYNIKGFLEYIPLAQFYTNGTAVVIDLGQLQPHLFDFQDVSVQSSNSMTFTLDADWVSINKPGSGGNTNPPVIIPSMKINAYEVSNSNMGRALRSIRARTDLSQAYQDYFAYLDDPNLSSSAFHESLESIESIDYLNTGIQLLSHQYKITQNNLFTALNPVFISSNLYAQKPILLAYAPQLQQYRSDSYINLGLFTPAPEQRYIFYLSPRYKYLNGDDYKGDSFGFDLSFGGANEISQLTFNFNYLRSKLDFDYADFKNNFYNASFNHVLNLDYFKVLNSASLGLATNNMKRQLYASNNLIKADYNNLLASGQIGLAKDFGINFLTITPLAYFNYNFLQQESFKENDGLFSKKYKAVNHHSISMAWGLDLSYDLENAPLKTSFSSFLTYERILSGSVIKNKVHFNDFPNDQFTQRYSLSKDLVTWGLGYEFGYFDKFIRLHFINEFAKNQYNFDILANLGVRF
ncbi:peptidase S8 [Campylobacter sp. MIT 99-7217]|uniref:S8 family serine peptidase n=1 Tax=Campylobacter sp. MIT 99-7217 TaxID=535091 RepID=UPI001156D42B|nr:S8 family serine peptidase [Campylobacter sp. MIT 99-7217]TQR33717.1 peptidase S8 [Campylobacter sp. MIT 99-7217]